MGYSTPKKQLDLEEFLSEPAKKLPFRKFGKRSAPVKPKTSAPTTPATDQGAEG